MAESSFKFPRLPSISEVAPEKLFVFALVGIGVAAILWQSGKKDRGAR